jgi:hypothetical protein
VPRSATRGYSTALPIRVRSRRTRLNHLSRDALPFAKPFGVRSAMRPRIAFRSRSTSQKRREDACGFCCGGRSAATPNERPSIPHRLAGARRSIFPLPALSPRTFIVRKPLVVHFFLSYFLARSCRFVVKGVQSKHWLRNRAISLRGGTKSYEAIILHSRLARSYRTNVVAASLCRGALRKEAIVSEKA